MNTIRRFFSGETELPPGKKALLGLQQALTMFGGTIMVPLLTGLSVSIALFMAGISTLIFHIVTKGKVPIFLGSSFAFIAPIAVVSELYGTAYALGGVVVSSLVYISMAVLVKIFGPTRVMKIFPPVVTGPIIVVIGLTLAPVAIGWSGSHWPLALVSFATVVAVSRWGKGFLRVLPVMCGLALGYVIGIATGNVDFSGLHGAAVFGLPDFTVARFNWGGIMIVVPVAIAAIVEHFGDMVAIEAITGKNPFKDPGVHRTLLGDGLGSAVSAMFGGPANTTYSENMGLMALTKITDPIIMRIAALIAIVLGSVPIVAMVIDTIPLAVIGGVAIILSGMIASVGFRLMVENRIDFKSSRNMIIVSTVVVVGLGGAALEFGEFSLGGVGLAAVVGIVLNLIIPPGKQEKA
jgi:uracil permease